MSMDEDLYNVGENSDMLDEENDQSDMDIDDEGSNLHGNPESELGNEADGSEINENDENEDEGDDDDDDDDDDGEDEEGGNNSRENGQHMLEIESSPPKQTHASNAHGPIETAPKYQPNALELAQNSEEADKTSGKLALDTTTPRIDSLQIRTRAREAVRTASEFDIVPIVAIPYASQCHAVALSEGPKWILTGGEDGFIRKYDFAASIEGKAPLTMAQKHNLMDNITKAGVIGSYWENEQPMTKSQLVNANPIFRDSDFTTGFASYEPRVNPAYSLDVEKNGLWCLSGLLSGGIALYTMIYNEGAIHHYFHHALKREKSQLSLDSGHLDAVSVLRLNHAQNAFLSGLWDKTIREWDLHTGKTKNLFRGSTGQISSVQFRPIGKADLTFGETNNSDVDSLFGSDQEEEYQSEAGDNSDMDVSRSSIKSGSLSQAKSVTSPEIFMSSSIDGTISIWDARISGTSPVLRLGVSKETPPWCMTASWSNDGDKIYAGRRNSTVEEFSLRMPHLPKTGSALAPNVLKRLMFPKISGPVSSLSVTPNDNFLFCGSNDNIRLYNLNLYDEFTQETTAAKKRPTPFYVIPGHHGGVLSNLIVDETGRFLISSSGNRGWGHAPYADAVLVYSIDTEASQQ